MISLYRPKATSINTCDVEVTSEMLELAYIIAETIHDQWALGRLEQGWTYGSERNDEKKMHPCLVPYEELSYEEKSFDRNTALETLKCFVKLGYTIEKK